MTGSPVVLEWKEGRLLFRGLRTLECVIASDFVLRIEAHGHGLFVVAVIAPGSDFALYRSVRMFNEADAKAEAVRQGRRVARQRAKTYVEIADLLGKVQR